MKNKSIIIGGSLVLFVVAVLLAILIIKNIKKPIDFETLSNKRFESTKIRLNDIREAQKMYKETNGHYTPSFDSLIKFIETGQLKVVKKTGNYNQDSMTEDQAIKAGKAFRDTLLFPVKDSLYNLRINYKKFPKDKPKNYLLENIKDLAYIPVGKKTPFVMDTTTIVTGSGVLVKSFQCYAMYDDILDGLDKQLIINKKSTNFEDIYAIKKITVKDSLNNVILKDTLFVKYKGKILDTTYYLMEDNALSNDVIDKKDLGKYKSSQYGYRTNAIKHHACLRIGHLKEANNLAGNWSEE